MLQGELGEAGQRGEQGGEVSILEVGQQAEVEGAEGCEGGQGVEDGAGQLQVLEGELLQVTAAGEDSGRQVAVLVALETERVT